MRATIPYGSYKILQFAFVKLTCALTCVTVMISWGFKASFTSRPGALAGHLEAPAKLRIWVGHAPFLCGFGFDGQAHLDGKPSSRIHSVEQPVEAADPSKYSDTRFCRISDFPWDKRISLSRRSSRENHVRFWTRLLWDNATDYISFLTTFSER